MMIVLSVMLFSNAFAAKSIASGKCGNNVAWSLSDNGVLTIRGSGKM
jgi:hypothetical protein